MTSNNSKTPGIDWQGLFKWSSEYSDGTGTSKFTALTKEEQEWLSKVMKDCTYNDTDMMTAAVKALTDHTNKSAEELMNALEELQDLIDVHSSNSTNLNNIGGFKLLMEIMFTNQHSKVRRLALSVFSLSVQNNVEMQEIAHNHGALELMYQYVKEEEEKNKEQIMGAFSSLIRTPITSIKAEFFSEMKGLDWLQQIILEKKASKRTLKKVFFLLYDLIVKETDKNIDTVLYQDSLIKDYILENNKMIIRMLKMIDYEDEENLFSDNVLREFIINCLGALFQYKEGSVTKDIFEYLQAKVSDLQQKIKQIQDSKRDEDLVEILSKENELLTSILENKGDFLLLKYHK
jgi:HPt (histidine-containing phosphotransfer) domain-containing protein